MVRTRLSSDRPGYSSIEFKPPWKCSDPPTAKTDFRVECPPLPLRGGVFPRENRFWSRYDPPPSASISASANTNINIILRIRINTSISTSISICISVLQDR